MTPAKSPEPVLTPGEWEALLFQAPEQIKHLVMRLAVFHGSVARPRPDECPVCGKHEDEAGQKKLFG